MRSQQGPYTIRFMCTILSLHFCIVSAIFLTRGVDCTGAYWRKVSTVYCSSNSTLKLKYDVFFYKIQCCEMVKSVCDGLKQVSNMEPGCFDIFMLMKVLYVFF